MAEYIDREALMAFPIRRNHCDKKNANPHFTNGIETVMEYAETIPAADVAPVARGRWEEDADCDFYCDKCGCYTPIDGNLYAFQRKHEVKPSYFCPRCGAKMDGGAE